MRLIKILRAFFGISRPDLCKASGISPRELTRIEAGEVLPKPTTLRRLDEAMTGLVLDRTKNLTLQVGYGVVDLAPKKPRSR